MQHCTFLYPLAWVSAPQVREARTCQGGEQEGQRHTEWVCGEGGGQHDWKAFFVLEREVLFVFLSQIEGEVLGSQVHCFLHCLYLPCSKAATDFLCEQPLVVSRVYSAFLTFINLFIAKAWYFSRLCTVVYLLEL